MEKKKTYESKEGSPNGQAAQVILSAPVPEESYPSPAFMS